MPDVPSLLTNSCELSGRCNHKPRDVHRLQGRFKLIFHNYWRIHYFHPVSRIIDGNVHFCKPLIYQHFIFIDVATFSSGFIYVETMPCSYCGTKITRLGLKVLALSSWFFHQRHSWRCHRLWSKISSFHKYNWRCSVKCSCTILTLLKCLEALTIVEVPDLQTTVAPTCDESANTRTCCSEMTLCISLDDRRKHFTCRSMYCTSSLCGQRSCRWWHMSQACHQTQKPVALSQNPRLSPPESGHILTADICHSHVPVFIQTVFICQW